MKYLKMIGLAAVAASALMAFVGASTASATTLEINGVTQNTSVTITGSLASGTSALLEDTSGFSQNTCKKSHTHGVTTKYTDEGSLKEVTGPLTGHTHEEKTAGTLPSSGLSFAECDRTVTVHDPGTLEVVHIADTTNGTVYSENAEVTSGSPFGTLTCITETTHLGTLTGVSSGHATLHVNAVLDCGISARWTATYTVTTPTGLGVSA
jgi:hypothetical protein